MTKNQLDKEATHPLQTRAWGEFREKWGNNVIYTKYGLITVHKIPFTNFKVGMLIKGPKPTEIMLKDLKNFGDKNNLFFIKLEPNRKKDDSEIKLLKAGGAVSGKTLFTPTTFWIDLTQSEENLLKSFQSKTRYNIRLAARRGVKIKEDNSDATFDTYIKLMRQTVKRQRFYNHTEKYHRLMWKTLHAAGIAKLVTASYKDEIVTAWILFVWKDFLYYPYGAFSGKHRNVMANNLIMWESIRLGKKLGLKKFDLWGREPGKGFTRFKEGYRPEVVEFLGTWDLVINKPAYYIYRVADTLRWAVLHTRSKFTTPSF